MKPCLTFFCFLIFQLASIAGEIPQITGHPHSQIAHLGTNVSFNVVSSNASYFQWRFNDAVIPGATNATLQMANVQITNSGYYVAIAINDIGFVPTELAYLSVVNSNALGVISLSNVGKSQAMSSFTGEPISSGTAWSLAGPELDQMKRVGPPASVVNGYFNGQPRSVPTVSPGQFVYYRVEIVYPFSSGTHTQQSTVAKVVAANAITIPPSPAPPPIAVGFPIYIEWPEPWLVSSPLEHQIRIAGETILLTNDYLAYRKPNDPVIQWRKNGTLITGATNLVKLSGGLEGGTYRTVLALTNSQVSDAGVYDVVVMGTDWSIEPKIRVSLQTSNSSGVFISPTLSGANFVSEFRGLTGRNYVVQRSSDLVTWSNLLTISNLTGTVMLTNPPTSQNAQFYRSWLLPY